MFGRADVARQRMAQAMAAASQNNASYVALSMTYAADLQVANCGNTSKERL
jgi:hypothetical protein